jgi:hypothetical protein
MANADFACIDLRDVADLAAVAPSIDLHENLLARQRCIISPREGARNTRVAGYDHLHG